MSRLSSWLDELGAATRHADAAEDAVRAEFARRIASIAEERAFAYRRANLMRAVADTVAAAADEETAVAHALAIVRTRLGWSSGSEVHDAIIERFAPVCTASFAGLGEEVGPDPADELAAFEAWYREDRGSPFWILFERHMPETPLVDF